MSLIEVTDEEATKLLYKAAENGMAVDFHFGPGWLALPWEEGQPLSEAILYLAELRGVTTENCLGAGI